VRIPPSASQPPARGYGAVAEARDTTASARALAVYRWAILPAVRRELRRWEGVAESMPDGLLRGQALAALREKGSNVEATAVFATLAPRPNRSAAVRASVALQVAVDYLDALGERPSPDPLRGGLALHMALVDALSPQTPPGDWYRLHPQREDGGYLLALVTECRSAVCELPSAAGVLPVAGRAAARCGEGQSRTHAAAQGEVSGLEAWARQLECTNGYLWWEVAAAASSSVAAHALIAAAADPETTAEEAELIDAAYFPPIGALTVLLDDLVDLAQDAEAGAHNYMAYYRDSTQAAARLALISSAARAATERLRRAPGHAAILAGVCGYYLSAPTARSSYAAPIRSRLIDCLGFPTRAILAFMRLSRRG
jgi:tetraprenyl-beta-curcumene synthase